MLVWVREKNENMLKFCTKLHKGYDPTKVMGTVASMGWVFGP